LNPTTTRHAKVPPRCWQGVRPPAASGAPPRGPLSPPGNGVQGRKHDGLISI
jgi:hypothetical protein